MAHTLSPKAQAGRDRARRFLMAKFRLYSCRSAAIAMYCDLYGDTATVTSGCYSSDWPDDARNLVRGLAAAQSRASQIALDAWTKGGCRASTFRQFGPDLAESLGFGRRSYYYY